jgi:hypothetical protein
MLMEYGAVEANPFKEVKLPKRDAPDQRLVTDEECRALWEAAGHSLFPRRGRRECGRRSVHDIPFQGPLEAIRMISDPNATTPTRATNVATISAGVQYGRAPIPATSSNSGLHR